MGALVKVLLGLALLAAAALAGGVYLALEDEPLVPGPAPLSPAEIERAKRLLAEHDPRTLRHLQVKTLALDEDELGLLLGHALGRFGAGGSLVDIAGGTLDAYASLELPPNPLGRFVNLEIGLGESAHFPRLERLRVGRVAVPAWLADALLERGIDALHRRAGAGGEAREVIESVRFTDRRVEVTYRWRSDVADRLRAQLVSSEEAERLAVFQARLAELTREPGLGRETSLATLVPPVFALARERSAVGDPVVENRAAILALAAYVNGRDLGPLLGRSDSPRPRSLTVTLHGRRDLAQHFIVSAALAVVGGRPLADAIGLGKEIDDSRGGSGFSFRDLAADNAGTRFGELASAPAGASQLQARASQPLSELHLLPAVEGLAENMTEGEFQARFGGVGSPAYQRVLVEIAGRIDASPLYRR